MKNNHFKCGVLALAMLGVSTSSLSADKTKMPGHSAHHNHIALFSGVTSSEHASDPTVGLEFERRLPFMYGMFGIGGFVERVISEHSQSLVGVSAIIHPWKNLKANFTIGAESADGHSETLHRVGLAYDFHIDQMSVSPTYNFDSVAGYTANVFGIAFGMGF